MGCDDPAQVCRPSRCKKNYNRTPIRRYILRCCCPVCRIASPKHGPTTCGAQTTNCSYGRHKGLRKQVSHTSQLLSRYAAATETQEQIASPARDKPRSPTPTLPARTRPCTPDGCEMPTLPRPGKRIPPAQHHWAGTTAHMQPFLFLRGVISKRWGL